MKISWKCPKCGARAGKHGKGKCLSVQKDCVGFICECDDEDGKYHGISHLEPCHQANCYHCGWGGVFPPRPKKIQAWEKKALESGWTPPKGR
jgi:hypothetical protein